MKGRVALYVLSLVLIGIGSSVIYWPAGFLVVGGLIWFDSFLTDFVFLLKKPRDSDG